jgi:60 kDa SS-A/Ro ribonucleoprotein
MTLRKLFSLRQTPQHLPIPGTDQVCNEAGGYTWPVDKWARLDRFLILGSESGTYYIGPRELTRQNATAAIECIQEDGLKVVARVVQVSETGRAPKNDPALFVLALCASLGELPVRKAALAALPQVARIGTHLFHFLEFVEGFRGWGRGLRRAVADWYTAMPPGRLAFQAIKYRQRDGWSHRDALRLAHAKAPTEQHEAIFHWITQGWPGAGEQPHPEEALQLIWAFERVSRAATETEVLALTQAYNLPWEAVPTQWLASPRVWEALAPELPLLALIRNLGRLTANGTLFPMGSLSAEVAQRITDKGALRAARVHPLAVLAALTTYAQGGGARGKLKWAPVARVVDALDKAFYLSFANVTPTGKRVLFGLDVSGSMAGTRVYGIPGLSARVATGAMALVTAAVEPQHMFVAFDTQAYPLSISPRQRLDDVVKRLARTGGGGTNCALPMAWAAQKKVSVDAFVILTDSQTWYGNQHPAQAVRKYRQKTGIPAKLVVVAMASNQHTIGDPDDGGVINVVGFDTATPQLVSDFIAGP